MRDEVAHCHRLGLHSNNEGLSTASEWLADLAKKQGLGDEQLFHLDLCASELIANVKEHAYAGAPGEVDLELEFGQDTLTLTVSDKGPPFNPLMHEIPPEPTSLEAAPCGGLGLLLVKQFSSTVRYERSDDGHNRVIVQINHALPTPHRRC